MILKPANDYAITLAELVFAIGVGRQPPPCTPHQMRNAMDRLEAMGVKIPVELPFWALDEGGMLPYPLEASLQGNGDRRIRPATHQRMRARIGVCGDLPIQLGRDLLPGETTAKTEG